MSLSPAPSATIRVRAPARLHLGFLDLNGAIGRRFGSIGLAVDQPETELTLRRAAHHDAHGLESARALALVKKFAGETSGGGYAVDIRKAIPAHAGLGSGTQLALAIGAYDGFFGPGTGTFLIAGFVGLLGLTLPQATADAKVVNFASNLASVLVFSYGGFIHWEVALPMAFGQLCGALIGAQFAMRGGERVVRIVVLCVSAALIAKLVVDLL